MARLHLAYRNFNSHALKATEILFSRNPWGDHPESDHYEIFNDWLEATAGSYNLPVPPTFELSHANDLVLGYDGEGELSQVVVVAQRFSVITLFFMFRSYMQREGLAEPTSEDALKWALSLFYTSNPKQFRRSVRRGLIPQLSSQDLLHPDAPLAFCSNCEENIWQTENGIWRHVETGHKRCPGQEIGSEVVATPMDLYAPNDASAIYDNEVAEAISAEDEAGPLLEQVVEAQENTTPEPEESPRPFACDPCGMTFSTEHHQRQHLSGAAHRRRVEGQA